MPLIIFIFHSIITINTAYYFKGLLITDKNKMAKNYFIFDFKIDFLSLTPLIISYSCSIR